MNVKISEVDNIEKYPQKVKHLKLKWAEQWEEISDNIYTAILLNSLLEQYPLAAAILETQKKLSSASILNRLVEKSRQAHRKLNQ